VEIAQEMLMVPGTPRVANAEASFDRTLSAERRRLYGVAYSILRDHSEAEDALQDAMLKAWKSWGSLRDESARQTWLVRICVNHCINRRSGLRLRPSRVATASDAATPDPRFEGRLVDLDRSYRALSPPRLLDRRVRRPDELPRRLGAHPPGARPGVDAQGDGQCLSPPLSPATSRATCAAISR
jgi:RNA polymerase sigma factor (sigma-70 family)